MMKEQLSVAAADYKINNYSLMGLFKCEASIIYSRLYRSVGAKVCCRFQLALLCCKTYLFRLFSLFSSSYKNVVVRCIFFNCFSCVFG